METVYISYGSNLGDREQNIVRALHLLSRPLSIKVRRLSSLYETEPTDGVGGSTFLNGVVKISTSRNPLELLLFLQSIESQLGRKAVNHSGPRTIDLDMILYGKRVVQTSNLILPHPKMTQRTFVLVPLIEIEPHIIHPTERKPLTEILSKIESPTSVRFYKNIAVGDALFQEECV